MNLQQLEYILAVDRFRHFAKAAEHCRVTQPTLSMMIQKLEDELGMKIFDRSGQPIRPTRSGERVIEQAKAVLHEAARVKAIANEEESALEGTFHLAVLPTIAPYLLPRFLPRLTSERRGLDLRVVEMKTAQALKALADDEVDAALIANLPEEDSLRGEALLYERFFGYLAREDPLFEKTLIRSADISGERLWLLDEGHCFRDQLIRFCQMEKVKLRQAAYRLGSLETFMRMVESGRGVTFIPELATLQLSESQRALVRPFALPVPARAIVWVTRRDFIRHQLAQVITDAIRASVPQETLTPRPGLKVM